MKINTPSEQPLAEPGSTTDLPPRKQLDQMFLRVESRLQQVMRTHRRLSPTLFTVAPGGLFVYSPGPINEVPEKNAFAATARLICASRGSIAAVLAIEAWVLEAKPGERLDLSARPSQSPHRKEYICLCGEALGSIYQQKLVPILRDHRGRFSCLGTPRVLPPEPTAGRFAKLLPQTPLNEDVRAFAALLLRDRGLFLMEIPFENKASTNARS